ncbi:unnamed protein product [Ixodes hexagonus]
MRRKCETLLVRHLPSALSESEKVDLLKFFGADRVRCMRPTGKLRHAAFATFPSQEAADQALNRLHQAELLGSLLVVEYASEKQHDRHFPTKCDQFQEQTGAKGDSGATSKDDFKSKMEEFSLKLHSLSSELGLDYVLNPMLRYAYPPPSPSTVANIATMLISVPKFYNQVLHLMNKMNLPAPFGPLLPQPPMMSHVYAMHQCLVHQADVVPSRSEEEYESSEEESEMESDGESSALLASRQNLQPQKRKKTFKVKRPKLQKLLPPQPIQPDAPKAAEVFDTVTDASAAPKPILFNIKPKEMVSNPDLSANGSHVESSGGPVVVEEGGFGLLASQPKPAPADKGEQEENPYDWFGTAFMSQREIRDGRISSEEMRKASVFRNYEPGNPASRLYIKNVAKGVEVEDLFKIYGGYVDVQSELEKYTFDIRLMKEGRMKGQAFLTFASESQAERARRDTNGFLLKGRPLVVHFARSAKAKGPTAN